MLLIEPYFEIQDTLDQVSLAERLEACGRVCYRSEDRIGPGTAIPFVRRVAEHGHNSVLEMAVAHFRLECGEKEIGRLLAAQPKYLVIDPVDGGLLVTGSIRAFRELFLARAGGELLAGMVAALAGEEPYLFERVYDPAEATPPQGDFSLRRLLLAEVEALPPPLSLRHRFVSVRLVVNRAVSHELVRHRPCSFLQESQRYCRYSEDKFANQVTFIKPLFFAEGSPEYQLWQEAMLFTEAHYLKLLDSASPQAARTVLPNSCKTEIIVFCNLLEWRHIFALRTSQAAEPSMREIMIPLAEAMRNRYPFL
jgi:thymidylate synthase (FAD)